MCVGIILFRNIAVQQTECVLFRAEAFRRMALTALKKNGSELHHGAAGTGDYQVPVFVAFDSPQNINGLRRPLYMSAISKCLVCGRKEESCDIGRLSARSDGAFVTNSTCVGSVIQTYGNETCSPPLLSASLAVYISACLQLRHYQVNYWWANPQKTSRS